MPQVCPKNSDTVCKCGKPKKATHAVCKGCRQKASYHNLKGACLVPRPIAITRSVRIETLDILSAKGGGPLYLTVTNEKRAAIGRHYINRKKSVPITLQRSFADNGGAKDALVAEWFNPRKVHVREWDEKRATSAEDVERDYMRQFNPDRLKQIERELGARRFNVLYFGN